MNSVVVLGSTGSIGQSTLEVAAALPDMIRIKGLAALDNTSMLLEQAQKFGVRNIAVADVRAANNIAVECAARGIRLFTGDAGVTELAGLPEADTVVCALVGLSGLAPVLCAIEAGHDVALATKEVLVAAGELVMQRRAAKGVKLLPLDSEHSAVFQCLQGAGLEVACVRNPDNHTLPDSGTSHIYAEQQIDKLILTASGGPFAFCPEINFAEVTPAAALMHPRWEMGQKVTVDSATLMNKGLEILEAHWLFNVDVGNIGVVVHPESIVHSLVSFCDGTTLAQLSVPDMRLPIQFALTAPQRRSTMVQPLNLVEIGSLTFSAPDEERFPALGLVREAAAQGGSMPAVLSAADEVAVGAFLQGKIKFDMIWQCVAHVMANQRVVPCSDLESILAADSEARERAHEFCRS